jgi:membrane-associated phospholipid phosphatase
MNNKIANILSLIFHPIFIPLYGIIILLNLQYFSFYLPAFKIIIVVIVGLFTCFIPGIFTLILFKNGYIESMNIEKRKNRHFVYFTSLLSYICCIYMLWRVHLPYWVLLIVIGAFISILSVTIINFFWKISAHATALGCFNGATFICCYLLCINPIWFFVTTILISGLVISARLKLNVHTIKQVIFGYLLGFFYIGIFPFLF